MSLDPITAEVLLNRLREIAATMEHALYHSGYSPILRESQDGTAGLTDAKGRVVIVSGGLQYHSIPYYHAVQGVLTRYPAGTMRNGDSFIVNDPYKGGNPHVPDMVAVTPVFYGGEIIAFAVSVAHKADVGGLVPGSSGAAAREIFHDGLLLPFLQPMIPWHQGVVLIHLPITLPPVVVLAGPDTDPANDSFGRDLRALRPGSNIVHDLVSRVVGDPFASQASPRLFFSATCSSISSPSTSSLRRSLSSRAVIRLAAASSDRPLRTPFLDTSKTIAPRSNQSFCQRKKRVG